LTTEFSPISELAARYVNSTNRHVFLTGKAGTGKTTFLRAIKNNTFKNTIIAAPTGVAAINAGGVTLHSLFQLPFGAYLPDRNARLPHNEFQKINTPTTLFKGLQLNSVKRKMLIELELLIIDEVSMLRADLLDAIDQVLRTVRRNRNQSFGGVQVLFIGDLLQLPPVVKEAEWNLLKHYYTSPYFFDALVLQQTRPILLELDKIYRQADNQFIHLLNNLRNNTIGSNDISLLNNYYQPDYQPKLGDGIIQLTTHNHKAEEQNRKMLNSIPLPSHYFKAQIHGDFNENSYPIDAELEIKVGAQIMFLKNDPSGQQRFFNGKIGQIRSIDPSTEEIIISFQNEDVEIVLEKHVWENVRYVLNETTNEIEEKKMGEFIHYPIKLAWAITIHKSQGLTFEKAVIDIGQAFAPGQIYVALSRLTSLNGLILTSQLNPSSLTLDDQLKDFTQFKKSQEELEAELSRDVFTYLQDFVVQSFDLTNLYEFIHAHSQSYSSHENKSAKAKYQYWAKELEERLLPLREVSNKFMIQLNKLFQLPTDTTLSQVAERAHAAQSYFKTGFVSLFEQVKSHKIRLLEEKKIKQYLEEVDDIEGALFKQLQRFEKARTMLEAAIGKKEFSKDNIHAKAVNTAVKRTELSTSKKKRLKKVSTETKPQKKDTYTITYELFKAGKSIETIAQERSLTENTIEGHLSRYVAAGELDVLTFITIDRLKNICTVAKELGTEQLNAIKNSLSDDYTYGEIKMALAYAQFQNNQKNL
jgi:GTPase SAR1 family protein